MRKEAADQLGVYAVALEFQKNELEKTNAELESLASTDALTGLKNRRVLFEWLESQFAVSARYGSSLSVVLLDVDHFKSFNDQFGHLEGDGVLRDVARLLQVAQRDCDLVARYGGEEFVIVCSMTDGAGAAKLAERVRSAIEAFDWPHRRITASIGIASLSASTTNASHLLAMADDALYTSKAAGRNRVTVRAVANRAA